MLQPRLSPDVPHDHLETFDGPPHGTKSEGPLTSVPDSEFELASEESQEAESGCGEDEESESDEELSEEAVKTIVMRQADEAARVMQASVHGKAARREVAERRAHPVA